MDIASIVNNAALFYLSSVGIDVAVVVDVSCDIMTETGLYRLKEFDETDNDDPSFNFGR